MEQLSCPNCEYENGGHGKPELRGEHIHCLQCGTSWKDISESKLSCLKDGHRDDIINELRAKLRQSESSHLNGTPLSDIETMPEDAFDLSQSSQLSVNLPITVLTVLAGLVAGGLALSHFNSLEKTVEPQETVSLSDVVFKEQVGRAGKKVITVRGLLENSTGEHQAIRPISIILRRKDGGEIVRWRHVSHKPILKAGGKSRFASSIQYDTPIISYAEAVFE